MRHTGIVAAALLLAACGGGGNGYSSAADVAQAADCTGYHAASPELFADDAGTCTHNGTRARIQWFNTADNRDAWVNAAAGIPGATLQGDNWVIECADRPACIALKDKIGGTLD